MLEDLLLEIGVFFKKSPNCLQCPFSGKRCILNASGHACQGLGMTRCPPGHSLLILLCRIQDFNYMGKGWVLT